MLLLLLPWATSIGKLQRPRAEVDEVAGAAKRHGDSYASKEVDAFMRRG